MTGHRAGFGRRTIVALAATALAYVAPLGTTGAAAGPLDGFTSDNVEFVANVPFTEGAYPSATGARLIGDYFYVRGIEALSIYDVSEPRSPELVGGVTAPLAVPFPYAVEDPDTNGRILVMTVCCSEPDGGPEGMVVDVSNKTNPRAVGRIHDSFPHTYTCVLDCRWAFAGGSAGSIVDLRDPANPRVLEQSWSAGLEFANPPPAYSEHVAHDLTEVAPGRLLTASTPMYLLDVRKNVTMPRVLARSDGSPHSFGGTAWPRLGRVPLALSWSESFQPPRCEVRDTQRNTSMDSAFKSWDTSEWRETGLIFSRDEYYIKNGTHTDGEPVFSGGPPTVAGCSASWFDAHPEFGSSGGLVALAAAGHGTKFLEVDADGQIEEIGWFLPHYGNAVAAYWITDEIVYVTDAYRGIDILELTEEF